MNSCILYYNIRNSIGRVRAATLVSQAKFLPLTLD